MAVKRSLTALLALSAGLCAQDRIQIEGIVLDTLSLPVPAAEVWADLWGLGPDPVVARGRTDGQGMFVLSIDPAELPPDTHRVTVKARSPDRTWDYDFVSCRRPGFVTLRLRDAVELRGQVVDGDGAPLANVIVFANYDMAHISTFEPSAQDRTGTDGMFALSGVPVGWATVRAWHPAIGMTEVVVRSDRSKGDVEIVLDDPPKVDVIVEVPEAAAADRARVSMLPRGPGGLLSFPEEMREVAVADGRAVFTGLSPTVQYDFQARSDSAKRWSPSRIRVDDAELANAEGTLRIAFERAEDRQPTVSTSAAQSDDEGQVAGRLLDAEGNPVAGVRLTVQTLEADGRWDGARPRYTDRAGRVFFPHVDTGVAVRIAIGWSEDLPVSEPMKLEPGERREDLVFTAPARASVGGTIVDGEGQPVGGARIILFAWDLAKNSQARGSWDALTDRTGRYRIPDLAPGGYYVLVRVGHGFGVLGKSQPFEVAAGETADPEIEHR